MKRAIVPITEELLGQMLGLPENVSIKRVRQSLQFHSTFDLLIEGDGLSVDCECVEGAEPKFMTPILMKTRKLCGCEEVTWDWG